VEVAEAFSTHTGMATVLGVIAQPGFQEGQTHHLSADLTGRTPGVTIQADIIKQKPPRITGVQGDGKRRLELRQADERMYNRAVERPPDRPCRHQVANCYMGAGPQFGGAWLNDFAEAITTGVINKRASTGLI
jgi:DhnA family fructose-bisphosphate aldolase class Ia